MFENVLDNRNVKFHYKLTSKYIRYCYLIWVTIRFQNVCSNRGSTVIGIYRSRTLRINFLIIFNVKTYLEACIKAPGRSKYGNNQKSLHFVCTDGNP